MDDNKGTIVPDGQGGTLLYCPNCNPAGHYTSFGSITKEGYITIKRKFGRATVIIASEFSLLCDCGYGVYYNNGTIVTSQKGYNYRGYERG